MPPHEVLRALRCRGCRYYGLFVLITLAIKAVLKMVGFLAVRCRQCVTAMSWRRPHIDASRMTVTHVYNV